MRGFQEAASHPTGPQSPSALSAVDDEMDLGALVRRSWAQGRRVDYLIVDEAQFFSPAQVEQLAQLADDAQVDVYAFGIATDFRGRLFPGSARLIELADVVLPLQVEVLCWCGRIGRFNGRVIDAHLVWDGATVVVADTVPNPGRPGRRLPRSSGAARRQDPVPETAGSRAEGRTVAGFTRRSKNSPSPGVTVNTFGRLTGVRGIQQPVDSGKNPRE